ncbi:MAG TPA: DUF5698 domain-containing protein [Aggregatilineales bacterium]|nr:DUF5698 domain-containing protein [Aggregatilineales bacterium]
MIADVIFTAVAIFVLRVINYAIGTVRMIAITRNLKLLAAILAAIEELVFAVVIAGVVSDLDNIINLTAYCAGAGVGSYVGMIIEARLVRGYMIVNVFANGDGEMIASKLREAGFGVTTTASHGRDGLVITLRTVLDKREMKRFNNLVTELKPDAFMVAEEARQVQRGWMGLGKGGRAIG